MLVFQSDFKKKTPNSTRRTTKKQSVLYSHFSIYNIVFRDQAFRVWHTISCIFYKQFVDGAERKWIISNDVFLPRYMLFSPYDCLFM